MRLNFLGADHEVTGSCHFLQACGVNILVDCGMEQGNDVYENQELPIPASEVDYVLLTHAHIDHSGLIPLLYTNGFRGKVYTTRPTVDLCEIMLKDSAHIQEFEAEWRNRMVDLMFAAIVAEQMEHRPELFLEAAIPYAGRLKTKNQQFQKLLRACKGVKVVCQEYAPSCFMQRNRYMAGESQRVIAVYDGRERGGTLFTMRYAHSIGREVREIRI